MSFTHQEFDQHDQPTPIPNTHPGCWELVIEEMKQRDLIGRERYGTPLQPLNGRDSLRDISDELLDAIVYTKQFRLELAQLGKELALVLALLVTDTNQTIRRFQARQILEEILQKYPFLHQE